MREPLKKGVNYEEYRKVQLERENKRLVLGIDLCVTDRDGDETCFGSFFNSPRPHACEHTCKRWASCLALKIDCQLRGVKYHRVLNDPGNGVFEPADMLWWLGLGDFI